MCLAVPMKVVKVEDEVATCEMDGVVKTASLMMLGDVDPVKEGDYVLIHAGFCIERLDEADAEETLRLFRELAEAEAGWE